MSPILPVQCSPFRRRSIKRVFGEIRRTGRGRAGAGRDEIFVKLLRI
ncbi:MAG: hypothetical protein AVDCRST_MAG05-77 [uncultured Rubrobacteraceae bacterium]|uniref:Uncharacterized protein n=1 Tax=uncultured Rubrobacteraceae bacterium TaxID=349277 RepID=A0A6J4R7E3_9ACTN|nr:MAG: hypothetical protein AVDCRST_MAG05-77 [uncultured Rubrobacteraceae bacterium]